MFASITLHARGVWICYSANTNVNNADRSLTAVRCQQRMHYAYGDNAGLDSLELGGLFASRKLRHLELRWRKRKFFTRKPPGPLQALTGRDARHNLSTPDLARYLTRSPWLFCSLSSRLGGTTKRWTCVAKLTGFTSRRQVHMSCRSALWWLLCGRLLDRAGWWWV